MSSRTSRYLAIDTCFTFNNNIIISGNAGRRLPAGS